MMIGLTTMAAVVVILKANKIIWKWLTMTEEDPEEEAFYKKMIEDNHKSIQRVKSIIHQRYRYDPQVVTREMVQYRVTESKPVASNARVVSSSLHSTTGASIPSDLVLDILSRLPVGPVTRFRRVCKQWRSLTYDAHFLDQHSKRVPHIILIPLTFCNFTRLPIYKFESPEEQRIKEYYPSVRLPKTSLYSLSNPVNGLVVVYDSYGNDPYHYLLNPVTQEVAKLPSGKLRASAFVYGQVALAFDASTGKYKLVKICEINFEDSIFVCEILTVGSQEWSFVGELPCSVFKFPSSFLNGTVYWMAKISQQPLHIGALAFDIKEEKFRVIPQLVHFPIGSPCKHFTLGQNGGQIILAEASRPPHRPFLRLLMLKDGENPEWKEVYNIDMTRHSDKITSSFITIINIKDGKILFYQAPAIFSYDVQRKVLRKIYHHRGNLTLMPMRYMSESFISPKSLLSDLPSL